MREYRIVADEFAGYEVQVRSWLWPFWRMAGFCNTFATLESAERYARQHARPIVKYLGRL